MGVAWGMGVGGMVCGVWCVVAVGVWGAVVTLHGGGRGQGSAENRGKALLTPGTFRRDIEYRIRKVK